MAERCGTLLHIGLEQCVQREDFNAAQQRESWPRSGPFTYSHMLPRCQMVVVTAFGSCSWLASVSSGDQWLTAGVPSAGTAYPLE